MRLIWWGEEESHVLPVALDRCDAIEADVIQIRQELARDCHVDKFQPETLCCRFWEDRLQIGLQILLDSRLEGLDCSDVLEVRHIPVVVDITCEGSILQCCVGLVKQNLGLSRANCCIDNVLLDGYVGPSWQCPSCHREVVHDLVE